MAWFFHLIEQVDGRWACRRGLQEYDTHAELHDAVEHVRALAAAAQPAELFVHRLDTHLADGSAGMVTNSTRVVVVGFVPVFSAVVADVRLRGLRWRRWPG